MIIINKIGGLQADLLFTMNLVKLERRELAFGLALGKGAVPFSRSWAFPPQSTGALSRGKPIRKKTSEWQKKVFEMQSEKGGKRKWMMFGAILARHRHCLPGRKELHAGSTRRARPTSITLGLLVVRLPGCKLVVSAVDRSGETGSY
ncbi:hypothetical protein TWF106_001372 [Orbilia oligospora]|uniref:Uncharacterized protein n=1 Tax=Orbilia oligospora TaxID=2813651 RepID=A0A6G1MH18_ORBOL|nr:hypothetical protein TWF788_007108 [Orbilia oligospora]KAF3203743.1 hypothetical protein TWF679_010096 [Orbilia oligospora]KAF3204969.1 hypothetical protein TWF106_001372 [Orbilia oligospora]KAF3207595.1 hypothetical protein TWF191_000984 [Orbilia oligospora]KAF3257090.1 hypothetical protein TWF192_001370 [Orbilia oligospora]